MKALRDCKSSYEGIKESYIILIMGGKTRCKIIHMLEQQKKQKASKFVKLT